MLHFADEETEAPVSETIVPRLWHQLATEWGVGKLDSELAALATLDSRS